MRRIGLIMNAPGRGVRHQDIHPPPVAIPVQRHPGVHADEGFKENALASSRLTEDTAVVPFFDFQRDMVRVGIAQKDR